MTNRSRGFTLAEVIVVIAIIALVSSLTFPVFSRARKSANRAASISNLRQCGVALLMYQTENDGLLPEIGPAMQLLATAPTCDPSDNWRRDCAENFGHPFIGSYAYVKGVEFFAGHDENIGLTKSLMVSVFYSDPEPPAFHGDYPTQATCPGGFWPMPTGLLTLRMDGSVYLRTSYHHNADSILGFNWPVAFTLDATGSVSIP